MMDAYSNVFASPGTRTTGTGPQKWMIASRDWNGEVPEKMVLFRTPTKMVWILGRIQINSAEDGATIVKDIQDQISLVPFSEINNADYQPPKGKVVEEYVNLAPVQAIQELDVHTFFNRLSQLMIDNPPPSTDEPALENMATITLQLAMIHCHLPQFTT